jgi:hypothetical protein
VFFLAACALMASDDRTTMMRHRIAIIPFPLWKIEE